MASKENTRNVFNAGEGAGPVKRSRTRKTAAAPVRVTAPAIEPQAEPAAPEPPAVEVRDSARPEQARAFAAAANGGSAELDRNEVARLAHSYWEARGCQGGSPEQDWLRAEQELRGRRAK